jgi:hypothetical protein
LSTYYAENANHLRHFQGFSNLAEIMEKMGVFRGGKSSIDAWTVAEVDHVSITEPSISCVSATRSIVMRLRSFPILIVIVRI